MRLRTRDGEVMKIRISALMDGELEDHEIAEALRALRHGPELRSDWWCDCQLIGAALRGERRLDIDVTARVMAAIEMEPTVMAPARKRRPEWQRPALALAASVAGVALVTWLALAPVGNGMPSGTAALAGAKSGAVVAEVRSTPRLQEYLLAHQAYSPGGVVVSGARKIRTVSASGEGR